MNTFAIICTFIGIAVIASIPLQLILFMVDGIKADRRIRTAQTAKRLARFDARLARLDDALVSIDAESDSLLQQLRTINNKGMA